MKILLAYPQNCDGSAYHRLHVPSLFLMAAGMDITRIDDIFSVPEHELAAYDVLVVNRSVTRHTIDPKNGHPMTLTHKAIMRIKASGIRLVVDLDDTWHVPREHPYHAHFALTKYAEAVEETIAAADEVWCSTDTVSHEVNRLDLRKPFVIIPNGISLHDRQWYITDRTPDPELRIGVVCNQPHLRDVARLRDALHAMRKIKGWRLMVIGVPMAHQNEVSGMLRCRNSITYLPWRSVYDYAKHYEQIDLLLCPLERNKFNLHRSDLKLGECAYTDTPVLTENYGPYAGTPYAVNNWLAELPGYVKQPARLLDKIPDRKQHLSTLSDQMRMERLHALIRN